MKNNVPSLTRTLHCPAALGRSHPQSTSSRSSTKIATVFAALLTVIGTLCSSNVTAAVTGSTKFIPTFLVYFGGGPVLTTTDAPKLGRYDMIAIDRYRYQQVGGSTWSSIKAYNPNAQIYLY